MDIKVRTYTDQNNQVYFDIVPENNMLSLDEENLQNAQVASFILKNSIPQLSGNDVGVSWLEFLMGNISFGELDAQIRNNIDNVGQADNFYPNYLIENEKLKVEITKVG